MISNFYFWIFIKYRICPIGEKSLDLCKNKEGYLLDVIDQGGKNANEIAKQTLLEMKEKVGILRKLKWSINLSLN